MRSAVTHRQAAGEAAVFSALWLERRYDAR